MNIMFFLKPKSEVDFLYDDSTFNQGIRRFNEHRFNAVPVIDREGRYLGTVTQGNFLWTIVEHGSISAVVEKGILIRDIYEKQRNMPLQITSSLDDVLKLAAGQNFVPVIDGRQMFIGIVTRRDVIRYLSDINGQL